MKTQPYFSYSVKYICENHKINQGVIKYDTGLRVFFNILRSPEWTPLSVEGIILHLRHWQCCRTLSSLCFYNFRSSILSTFCECIDLFIRQIGFGCCLQSGRTILTLKWMSPTYHLPIEKKAPREYLWEQWEDGDARMTTNNRYINLCR